MSRTNLETIIREVSEKCSITDTCGREIIKCFIDTLGQALINDEWIVIRGFGTFTPYYRKGRKWKNPATLKDDYIKPCKTVRFKASKKLKRYN